MPKLTASLSIDLDNKWAYLKTHGDEQWSSYPSYLGVVIPRILKLLDEFRLTTTFFVVGQDASDPQNHQPITAIAKAGHEIANHSFQHDPWLHRYSPQQLEDDLARTETCLRELTGQHPVGFRGPGFSHSVPLLQLLAERGYEYECSTFPTFIGPLARLYYFAVSRDLSREEREERKQLFGGWKQGFRPLRPYRWSKVAPSLVEIPVTT
ncbi:MAG: polysaccharide deacetylase family protein, partial [Planctomycetota bacterium]